MFRKFQYWLIRFMDGRYGNDKLNNVFLIAALVLTFLGVIFKVPYLTLLAYIPLGYSIFRTMSRNKYARYEENRKFLGFWSRLTDRDHRYFRCKKCRQIVRVPKGKGKISITCPKCGEKFIKRT